MLRAGGTLVASVPVTPSMDSNPDHYTDFSQTSIRSMARQCDLDEKACFSQLQSFKPQTLMGEGAIGFYKKHPEKLLARIGSTFRNGFQHRFLTVAWTKRS